MRTDSVAEEGEEGAKPLLCISFTWLPVIIVPSIKVVCQSSLLAITCRASLKRKSCGSARIPGTPNCDNVGPSPRITTLWDCPVIMNPAIPIFASVCTDKRVETLASEDPEDPTG